ncbi:LemA family protein [Paludibaculum fermentans]|uniref:LemA family protein n=1 Tax=Paludibaculum fermentans TaxID=1473598 RepID=A0A7S7NMG4_PALFE|nr:LemA family protein [Paludibaculum fermentans]QOY86351.1 LemA family protein [Paludibaculum fermentans]
MKTGLIIGGIILVLVLIIGGKAASANNELVTKQEAIRGAWSQVDVALQRRADLIPNLVETVKGFAAQEKQILETVANARSALLNAKTPGEKIQANQGLDSAIGRLLVVVENYPNLKSNENFMRLQDELAGTENRIAVERRKYNETVQTYNTSIGLFPTNLFAGMMGFHRNDDYFKTEPGARTAPAVKF